MHIRNNKGITIITLIITIIIILILAGVGIYNAWETYEYSQMDKFVITMKLVQEKVELIEYDSANPIGEVLPSEYASFAEQVIYSENLEGTLLSDWRFFSEKNVKEKLELEDIGGEFLVNFETKEVISVIGVKYEDKMYYTQYNLPNGQKVIQKEDSNFSLDFDLEENITGLNAEIKILNIRLINSNSEETKISNGIIKYKMLSEEDSAVYGDGNIDYYEKYSEDETDNWHTLAGNVLEINATGRYAIAVENLQDSKKFAKEIKITLTNAPSLKKDMVKVKKVDNENYLELNPNEEWKYKYEYGENSTLENAAFAKLNDDIYVWIPRFAYKEDEEENIYVKFLKGNSNISTDNKQILVDDDNWKIPSVFERSADEQPYRGVWVKVEDINLEYNITDIVLDESLIPEDFISVV